MLEMMTGSLLKKLSEPGLQIVPNVFQKLIASDGAAGDYFGISVAVSGNSSTIIVGTYLDDDKGTDSGSVYVFKKQVNGSYLQTQKLMASDGAASDWFGVSVAVSQTFVVVSTNENLGKGAVYIY